MLRVDPPMAWCFFVARAPLIVRPSRRGGNAASIVCHVEPTGEDDCSTDYW
jgi:hypothetical protein